MQCMQRRKEPCPKLRLPRRTPRGTPGAQQSVDMKKGLTTFPLVRPCFRLSRLSESNRRPSHYERPRNARPGISPACDATHAMPETTSFAFRGYAGVSGPSSTRRLGSCFAAVVSMRPSSAFGASACKCYHFDFHLTLEIDRDHPYAERRTPRTIGSVDKRASALSEQVAFRAITPQSDDPRRGLGTSATPTGSEFLAWRLRVAEWREAVGRFAWFG